MPTPYTESARHKARGEAEQRAGHVGRPLSFDDRSEHEAVETLIHLHAPYCGSSLNFPGFIDGRPPYMLDVTYGAGGIWEGQAWRPQIAMDTRPLPGVNCVGDFRDLSHVAQVEHPAKRIQHLPTDHFDIVAFDPPYMAEAGANSKHVDRFETEAGHADIEHLYLPFLAEARRVLKPNGIILAKLQNNVHRGRMRWQAFNFARIANSFDGLSACDYKIVPANRASTLTGANWDNVRHTRRNDVVWFVVRKGGCMRPLELACPHKPEWRRGHVDDE